MKTNGTQLAFAIVSDGSNRSALSMTIDLAKLQSHLWEAANILRGPVDAADFKTYIFPLLFFKRISDVHVPDGAHWLDVRSVATNVGQALQVAMRDIEKANPETLYGIFGDAAWSNKERLPDALLRDLIEHFSRIGLGNEATQTDILGQSRHGETATVRTHRLA